MQLKYHKWISKLLGYDSEVHYRLELENKAAKARMHPIAHLASLTTLALLDMDVAKTEVSQDPNLNQIIAPLTDNPDNIPKY